MFSPQRNAWSRPRGARQQTSHGAIRPGRFQSTRPRGARHQSVPAETKNQLFQSTRPRGARPRCAGRLRAVPCFNPRARVGRDTWPVATNPEGWDVSIHAPAWGATLSMVMVSPPCARFNPRARVGRDSSRRKTFGESRMFQSTRPRGARLRLAKTDFTRLRVSIHAPAWGATRVFAQDADGLHVSIHAPAWGATLLLTDMLELPLFQSTRPRGARRYHSLKINEYARFQSTRPRGARQGQKITKCRLLQFQSTRPRGARQFRPDALSLSLAVSIHAPAWGATKTEQSNAEFSYVSIHAPAWGATRRLRKEALAGLVSIHAPAWGATS